MNYKIRPHESHEDNFALWIGIFFIVGFFAVYVALTTYNSGVKYIILKFFGTRANATIVSIEDHPKLYMDVLNEKESDFLILFNDMAYSGELNLVTIELFDPGKQNVRKSYLIPKSMNQLKVQSDLHVYYLRSNDDIFLPDFSIDQFRYDAKLLLGSAAVLSILALICVAVGWRWRKFRLRNRRY